MKAHFSWIFKHLLKSPLGLKTCDCSRSVLSLIFSSPAMSYPSWRVFGMPEPSSMTTQAILGSFWMSTCDSELSRGAWVRKGLAVLRAHAIALPPLHSCHHQDRKRVDLHPNFAFRFPPQKNRSSPLSMGNKLRIWEWLNWFTPRSHLI